jgi:ribosomal protein L11 methyltransferase
MSSPLNWHCLSVFVPPEATEAVANFLTELGSTGVVEGTHDPAQPAPSLTEVQGFFPGDCPGSALCQALARYLNDLRPIFPQLGNPQPRLVEVSSESWADRWQDHFPPLMVGERFLILPPWESHSSVMQRTSIIIDPSMAFGTGHHVTTQGCLEAIEWYSVVYGSPARALDVGTGSGILAIALAKLGTQEIWATDTDPVALEEAQKNITTNQVAPHIRLSQHPIEQLPLPFPFVVANLFSFTLVQLAPTLAKAVTPKGYAVLSGIQQEQEVEVLAAYTSPVWQVVRRYPREEWVTLVLQHC